MEHEQRDSYLIPPNFIEGGTLMGGMFKTRNVIEAGILGAAVGLPVMSLGLSLTARIIILCLTALPLVLLALIGVGGSSLSGFILLFFSYLRNRRVLSQDAPARGRDGKELSMLPTWSRGKKSAPDTGEDEARLKSRSRFQVDLKERKVNQFKTFLDPEEKVRPLNPLADYIPYQLSENCPGQDTVQGADQAGGHQPPHGYGAPGAGPGDGRTLPSAARGLSAADPAAWLPGGHHPALLPGV